jgi:hypothetical protein
MKKFADLRVIVFRKDTNLFGTSCGDSDPGLALAAAER